MDNDKFVRNKSPKVAIIIVQADNYIDDIVECLDSLNKLKYNNFYVIIINNGVKDINLKQEIRKNIRYSFPIKHFKTKFNLGFSGGNNLGIRQALRDKSDYILLLNNDTVVDDIFLTNLIGFIQKKKILGIIGPVILNYNTDIIQSAGIFYNLLIGTGVINEKNKRYKNLQGKFKEVGYIDGCAILIPSEIFNYLGLLNVEYYPGFYEETEFCIKARKQGVRSFCVYNSKIWHKGGQTFKRKDSIDASKLLVRNRFLFMYNNVNFFRFIIFIVKYLTSLTPLTTNRFVLFRKVKNIISSIINIIAIKKLHRIVFFRSKG